MVETTLQIFDRKKIGQCLSRMIVSTVPGIDHRNRRVHGRYKRRTFFGMTHRTDVRIRRDDTDRIGYAFAFGS